jgi:hypothetical protein
MIDVIRECRRIVHDLRGRIARLRSAHVNRGELLDAARSVVDGYFRTDRPLLLKEFRREDLLTAVDGHMHGLLRLAQGRSRKGRYLDVLGAIDRAWRDVELTALPLARPLTGEPRIGERQETLARTLDKVCPAAAACYRQGLTDLGESSRGSWRGTATELRETLRELLDTLAPDEVVMKAPGFKPEDGAKAPTMKQKTRFILKSRQWSESARKQVEEATDVVEAKVGGFVRSVYSGSSASVHTSGDKKEVLSVLRFVETALAELLELEGAG